LPEKDVSNDIIPEFKMSNYIKKYRKNIKMENENEIVI